MLLETVRQKPKRILLGHLNSNGDCLYATAVAHQIKTDYPNCHLTWAISSLCRSIIDGNPHVDEVWEIPLTRIEDIAEVWQNFEREALARQAKGDFEEVFFTQFSPGRLYNYDGTIRSSTFRGYPKPITVSVAPVIRLSVSEVEKVRNFAHEHHLLEKSNVILFECSPKSGQSFVTPEFALEVARKLVTRFPNICVILSSNIQIVSDHPNILDGSVLSLRENAELTKYCSLLIGCSSGVSWISTSDWAKPIPKIQLLKSDSFWFASFIYDHQFWGLLTDSIIEMIECSTDVVVDCVTNIFNTSFCETKAKFDRVISINFNAYGHLQRNFLKKLKIKQSVLLFWHHFQRNNAKEFIQWHFYKLYQIINKFLVIIFSVPNNIFSRKVSQHE